MFYVQETPPCTIRTTITKSNSHTRNQKKKNRTIKKNQIMFAPASRFAQQNQLNHNLSLYACKNQATRTQKKVLQLAHI